MQIKPAVSDSQLYTIQIVLSVQFLFVIKTFFARQDLAVVDETGLGE